ncbi:MAG: hypothetical protein EBZ59_10795 [Planctomycetia bacterium]|nr:hypothetical protein [Planctomycetia bacterium]
MQAESGRGGRSGQGDRLSDLHPPGPAQGWPMNAAAMRIEGPARAGITLLEVLIAIGILAVGLGSVAALMPAGQSQASRALVLDRAAVLAANALADTATFGLLRDGTAVLSPAATAAAPLIIDSATNSSFLTNTAIAQWGNGGVAASSSGTAPVAVRLVTELRDDVMLTEPQGDDLPLNVVSDGARAFRGRMSCLLCLKPGAGPAVPGTLSAVVFHARATASPLAVTGSLANLQVTQASLNATQLDGRRMRDVVRSGVVLWDPANRRFHQVAAAAYDTSGTTAYLTLQSGAALATGAFAVQFLPDSVGLAERPYLPESTSEYTQ